MRHFVNIDQILPMIKTADHGGNGAILFRRLCSGDEFESPIDFIDYTVIPPQSTIGAHQHLNNEEVYFVMAGTPLVNIDGNEYRLGPGSTAIVRSGQTHRLVNDSDCDSIIFVIQVSIPKTITDEQ